MNYYKRIPIWENRKRVDFLVEFKKLVCDYFSNVSRTDWSLNIIENEIAKQTRSKINMKLQKAHSIIKAAGVNSSVFYTPPAIGGSAMNIDVILNIFHLHLYRIEPQEALDIIDRAIGIYKDDEKSSLFRTFNPFFWLSLVLDYIVTLLFKILGKIGLNQEKIETSIVRKVIKGILYLITIVVSFLTILEKLGYLEAFKSLIKNLLK